MILYARPLANVASVNSYDYAQNVEFTEGDAPLVYVQLVDASKDLLAEGFKPPYRRYCTASGATLTCVVDNVDDAKKVTRSLTLPFPGDTSIWLLTLMASDPIKGTCNLRLTLTEGLSVKRALVPGAFRVRPQVSL